jgi:hypothetical protein
METERDFDPNTMQLAQPEDILRIWNQLYGHKSMKPRYGSFYSSRIGGYVYVAKDADNIIKVGGANNVQKRMHQLRQKHPSLKLLATIPARRFMDLEKFIHYELEEYRVRREWYYSEDERDIFGKIENLINKHGELFEASLIIFE